MATNIVALGHIAATTQALGILHRMVPTFRERNNVVQMRVAIVVNAPVGAGLLMTHLAEITITKKD